MKTRYIFTDSNLETIYDSFVVEGDQVHQTMISDLQEINTDKSIRKNIIFFNSEFLNSCSLNEFDKSDDDKLLKAKFFSSHVDQLLLNPSELTFFPSSIDNIGIWGESCYLDKLKSKTFNLRKSFFIPDYLLFFEQKNVVANLGSHYSLRLEDGRGYSGRQQKINALLESNIQILNDLDVLDVSPKELECLQNLEHSLNKFDLSSQVYNFHTNHSSQLNILKTPLNINRLLYLDVIGVGEFRNFAIPLLTTFLLSISINITIESQNKLVSKETKQLFSNLGNQSVRLINPKAQIDQLVSELQITDNKSQFDIKFLDFLYNYPVDELESIEVNLDEQFTTLYLDGLSSEKLIILINLLNSSGLSTEENFAEAQNKLKGSIKVFLYE